MVHFLGQNFSHFQTTCSNYLETVRVKVLQIVGRYPNVIETDHQSIGNFITCYVHQIPGSNGNSEEFLRDLFWHTGACLIPAVRSYVNPDLGFSFRVNLARACPQFYSAISRVAALILVWGWGGGLQYAAPSPYSGVGRGGKRVLRGWLPTQWPIIYR